MRHAYGLQKSMMLTHSVSCLNDIKLGYQHCIILHLTPIITKPLVTCIKCHDTCPVWSGLHYLPQFHGLQVEPLNALSPNRASPKWPICLLKLDFVTNLATTPDQYRWVISIYYEENRKGRGVPQAEWKRKYISRFG
jgi:hypothetical protein